MTKQTFTVKGMHCKSCAMLVQDALESAGAKDIMIKIDEAAQIGKVVCTGDDRKKLVDAIVKEGYTVA